MPVTIQEMQTDITVDTARGGAAGEGASAAPAEEVRIEDLRAIVRELVAEEMERYRRLAIEH